MFHVYVCIYAVHSHEHPVSPHLRHAGGSVVCTGPAHTATFHRCKFDDCPLYAAHGAAITLTRCHLACGIPTLVASGPGTVVTLRMCSIKSRGPAITVEGRATLLAAALRLRGAPQTMIMFVNDAGSRVDFRDSTIRGGVRGTRATFAAWVTGGHVSLRDCGVSAVDMAVYALTPATTVEVVGGYIEECKWGVCAASGARATLRDVEFDQTAVGADELSRPVAVSLGKSHGPTGGAGQVERCAMYGPEGYGVNVSYGARGAVAGCRVMCPAGGVTVNSPESRVVVAGCAIGDSVEACKVCSKDAVMRVERCEVEGVGGALIAVGGSLVVVDTRVHGGGRDAVNGLVAAEGGGAMTLLRCDVEASGVGVRVTVGTARAVDTRVAGMTAKLLGLVPLQPSGLQLTCGTGYACMGGLLEVVRGTVDDCVVGVMVRGGGARHRGRLKMNGVDLRNYHVGLRAYDGAEVEVADCGFTAGRCTSQDLVESDPVGPGVGYVAAAVLYGVASGGVRRCRFEGNWWDVAAARARAPVVVTGCEHRSSAPGGVCVNTMGDAVVEACTFEGVERGVTFAGGVCTVRDCVFGPGVSTSAIDGEVDGRATVTNCTFRGANLGVRLCGTAAAHAQDCVMADCAVAAFDLDGGGGACWLAAKRVEIRGGMHGVTARSQTSARPSVKLVDCSVANIQKQAVHLSGAEGVLLRCQLDQCGVGVCLDRGASGRVRKSTLSECAGGLRVEARDAELECGACGRAGQASLQAAARALRAAGGDERAGARCAHEGATARLVLEEVEVKGCAGDGLVVGPFGHVTAKDVRLVGSGAVVTSLVERSRFEGCTVEAAAGFRQGGQAAPVQGWRYVSAGAGQGYVREAEAVEGIEVVAAA